MLKDGDEIAIVFDDNDDYQTDEDTILREEFQLKKESDLK